MCIYIYIYILIYIYIYIHIHIYVHVRLPGIRPGQLSPAPHAPTLGAGLRRAPRGLDNILCYDIMCYIIFYHTIL